MQLGPFLIDHQTPTDAQESSLNTELSRLPTNLLAAIRQELGLVDRELRLLTLDEKSLIINIARNRGANPVVGLPGPGPTNNLAMGIVNYGASTRIGAPQMHRDTATRTRIEGQNDVYAIIDGLAMVNLSGGGSGTPFNPAPEQDDDQGQVKFTGMMLPPSQAGSPPKEPSQLVNEPPTPSDDGCAWRLQLERYLTTGKQRPSHGGASPPTSRATGSSIPADHDDVPTMKQGTSLPEVPAKFLTPEFMESVARELDNFGMHALSTPQCWDINIVEDFRSWFNPDDMNVADDPGITFEEDFRAWFDSDDTDISKNTDISFEPDFGE